MWPILTSRTPGRWPLRREPLSPSAAAQFRSSSSPKPRQPAERFTCAQLEALGIDPRRDIRFVEDGEFPGAAGATAAPLGVWLDGRELTQFTVSSISRWAGAGPGSVEITYRLERIAMLLQRVHNSGPALNGERTMAMCC